MGRHDGTALAAALGLLMLLPISLAPARLTGVEEEDEDAPLDVGAVLLGAADILAWLLVGATAAVALVRDGREGKAFWAWCALLALAALAASVAGLARGWSPDAEPAARVRFTLVAVWTATAGLVAALFLPWGRMAARSGGA